MSKVFLIGLIFASIPSLASANELGKKVYGRCLACHGLNGEGKASQNTPKLQGQYSWYLERQIRAFKNKERTGKYAKMMYPFVSKLTDSEIKAVSEYISELDGKK